MFREGVSALILNSEKKFLLVNLTSFEEKYYAIPGGGMEKGEIPEQAVYRELNEELGLVVSDLQYIGQSKEPLKFKFKEIKLNRDGNEYKGSLRHFFGFEFIGENKSIVPFRDEVRAFEWVSYNNLDKFLLFENQSSETKKMINEIFKNVVF